MRGLMVEVCKLQAETKRKTLSSIFFSILQHGKNLFSENIFNPSDLIQRFDRLREKFSIVSLTVDEII